MFEAVVDAISRAISTGNTFGIAGGIAAFIIVILYSISKAGEAEKIKQLPKEVQLRIEMRKDNIEFSAWCLEFLALLQFRYGLLLWYFLIEIMG